MGRAFQMLLLCLLSFAFSCGDGRTLDNERIGTSASKLVAPNGLTYPLASMSSWSDANYGKCGTGKYTTGQCHIGSDFAAAAGTPVYPIASGTVVLVSNNKGNPIPQKGKCSSGWGYDYYDASLNATGTNTCNDGILVQHLDASGKPFISLYGHLRHNSSIHIGDPVPAGQPIGAIGGYYNVDGTYAFGSTHNDDHLHWGIIPGKHTQ